MSYWLVRMGENSKYTEDGIHNKYIGIGWNELNNLSIYKDIDSIKNALKASYEYSNHQNSTQASQIFNFVYGIKDNDYILTPKGDGFYYVGIAGKYFHCDHLNDICPFRHRREVNWLDVTLNKHDMSTNLSYTLGALLTIFSLDRYGNEIDALIRGVKSTPAEKPQSIKELVLDGLLQLDGREFEEFVKDLLVILGFSSKQTQYSKDKGIDVIGTLNAEGLAEIKLQVQVKRYSSGSVSGPIVRQMKGSLSLDEHGCIITTSYFSKDAIEEANKVGHKTIKIIDGYDLSEIVLKHFDDIDDKYKSLFPIKRRKDINIEDQFELNDDNKTEIDDSDFKHIDNKSFDTIVCSARQDGFEDAFLKKRAWWQIPLNKEKIQFIKYIAIYQIAPLSQITHYGKIKAIDTYQDTEKYILYLDGDPIKLEHPVSLGKNRHLKPQGPKYTKLENILKAKSLDDVF